MGLHERSELSANMFDESKHLNGVFENSDFWDPFSAKYNQQKA